MNDNEIFEKLVSIRDDLEHVLKYVYGPLKLDARNDIQAAICHVNAGMRDLVKYTKIRIFEDKYHDAYQKADQS